MTILERFEQKYIKRESGCWEWTACSRGNGYGCFKFEGRLVDSHRVSYILYKEDIPTGKLVCHTCDNRLCVNPDHLFLGSYKDNYDDAVIKGRIDKNILAKLPRKIMQHPSNAAYDNGCRCDECRDLHKLRMRGYRKISLSSSVGQSI